jgi:hypothetical protein
MTPSQRRRLFCLGLAGGVFVGCLTFQAGWSETPRPILAILWLVLLCGSLGSACHQVSTNWACRKSGIRLAGVIGWSGIGWLLCAIAALAAWPWVDAPHSFPLRTWLTVLSLLGWLYAWGDRHLAPEYVRVPDTAPEPAPEKALDEPPVEPSDEPSDVPSDESFSEGLGEDSRDRQTAQNREIARNRQLARSAVAFHADQRRSIHRAVMGGGMAVAMVAIIQYLLAITPQVGGVDFYYYVCNARDMLLRPEAFSPRAYSYFPGVYAFWRAAWLATGGSLLGLQASAVLLVVANSLVLGWIVHRACRSIPLGAMAGFWYLLLASRFEGFAGVTEPLATLPWLVGLAIWQGTTLRGPEGWKKAIGLGIAFGLTTYAKQQAGLLTLGAIAWLVERPGTPPDRRHDIRQLILVPLVAVGTLLIGILAEGRGMLPLLQGGQLATAYAREGTWLWNLYVQVRHDETAALFALFSLGGWGALYFHSWRNGRLDRPWLRLASFAILAGLATLIQFRSRPYGHYALLGIPCLILVTLTCGHSLAKWYFFPVRRALLPHWLVAMAVTFPVFVGDRDGLNLLLWNLRRSAPQAGDSPWHEDPRVLEAVQQVSDRLPPGETIYVLPPYRTELYFLLEGHSVSEFGYRFQAVSPEEIPWGKLAAVVEVHAEVDTHPQRNVYWTDVQPLIDILPDRGFQVTLRTPAISLWQPESPSHHAP